MRSCRVRNNRTGLSPILCLGVTGATGSFGPRGERGPDGGVGATGATGLRVQGIHRRVVRAAGCPGNRRT